MPLLQIDIDIDNSIDILTITIHSRCHPSINVMPLPRVHLFRGMRRDVRRRAPFYASDWADAWDYRVVPATVYMFFAK